MKLRKLSLAMIGLGIFTLLVACGADETQKIGDAARLIGPANCVFSIPKEMRALRKTYDDKFSAPDSEGNVQSYETCKAGVAAAERYSMMLKKLANWIPLNCHSGDNIDNHLKKIAKTRADLERQVEETNCGSLYGE